MLADDAPHTRRRWPALTAAAAVVIALVVGIALITRDDKPEVRAGPGSSPEVVLRDYVEAFNAHDLDAVMALYAQDAVVTGDPLDSDQRAEGLTEIRASEQENLDFGESFEAADIETTGNTVTFGHIFRVFESECYAGTNRVVVEEGKIVR